MTTQADREIWARWERLFWNLVAFMAFGGLSCLAGMILGMWMEG